MRRLSIALVASCASLATLTWGLGAAPDSPVQPSPTPAAKKLQLRNAVKATLASALLTLPACVPSEAATVAGTYAIDAKTTGQNSGLMAFLVEAAVTGSTLELKPDLTYVGRKDGETESAGTWSIQDGQLTMKQTHEQGKPVANTGKGTIRDGVVTVKTKQRGMVVTLVFKRKS